MPERVLASQGVAGEWEEDKTTLYIHTLLLSRLAQLPLFLPGSPLSLRYALCFPQTQSSQERCQPWGKALPELGQGLVASDSREGLGGRAHPAALPAQRLVRMRAQVTAPAPSAWCPSPAPGLLEILQVGRL